MPTVRVERLTDRAQFAGATVVVDYGGDEFMRGKLVYAAPHVDRVQLHFESLPTLWLEVGRSVLVFWPDEPWRELGIPESMFVAMTRFDIDPKIVEELKLAGLKITEEED